MTSNTNTKSKRERERRFAIWDFRSGSSHLQGWRFQIWEFSPSIWDFKPKHWGREI